MLDATHAHWRIDRPAEGFYATELPALPGRPVRTFLPTDYQPRYAYPLVVSFHAAGGSEENGAKLLPRLSRRNYIGLSLRGPHADGRGFGWSDADPDALHDYLLAAVEQTRRTYHVHSERVFLVGVGDGAAAAFRVGLRLADKVAGIVSLNGMIPKPNGRPLFNLGAVRRLPVFFAHGVENRVIPYATAERDFKLLYAAGADVKLTGYPTTQKLHSHMLRDVNRWIMGGVTSGRGVAVAAH